jgi:hypothetical protein
MSSCQLVDGKGALVINIVYPKHDRLSYSDLLRSVIRDRRFSEKKAVPVFDSCLGTVFTVNFDK